MFFFFFFNDTATTEIYTLSLHDALPISHLRCGHVSGGGRRTARDLGEACRRRDIELFRSEEHTSELQSHLNLVCRLLLEKKKTHSSRATQGPCCRSAAALRSGSRAVGD